MKKIITVALICVCGLSACKPLPPGHDPNHCPPGHAKKGWC